MITELYIVEGSSAASTVQQSVSGASGRQVWSMQGKLPNVANFSDSKVLANTRCRELLAVLSGKGVGTPASTTDADREAQGWDTIYIVSDADVDGQHATVLLLAIVERFMPELIRSGRLHVIATPLYRIKSSDQMLYAYNEQERHELAPGDDENVSLTRFKSVAQMSADECWRFILAPTERRSVQLTLDEKTPPGDRRNVRTI